MNEHEEILIIFYKEKNMQLNGVIVTINYI